ncbi:MAG: hypothetical protein ACRELY_33115 [Polyangiaceae bacterium]
MSIANRARFLGWISTAVIAGCGGSVAATTSDAGSENQNGVDAGPVCGATGCEVGQACCMNGNANPALTCIAPTGACQGLRLECTGTASCPTGQVCCGVIGVSGTASCASECAAGESEVCWDGVTTCPTGTFCQQHFAVHYCS